MVAAVTTEMPAMLTAKKKTMVTSTTKKTSAQIVRWEAIPVKGQEVAIKHHALDDYRFFKIVSTRDWYHTKWR